MRHARNNSILHFDRVGKQFHWGQWEEKTVLRDISFSIPEGLMIAITGPSGSGKSTLLSLAGLIDTPTQGEIYFKGKSTSGFKEKERTFIRRETCGFIYQFSSLIPTLNVLENVLLPAILTKKVTTHDVERAEEWLDMIGLAQKKEHVPHQLSGGEQRRVALVRALFREPSLLLADEPTADLDAENAQQVLNVLQVQKKAGKTILLVTHDAHLASQCDQVIGLHEGYCDT